MTPRQIAAAIRMGAKMRPQCSARFFADGKSCAIGAAIEGIGKRDEALKYYEEEGACPFNLAEEWLGVSYKMLTEIYDKNDCQHMTREQVADWLDTLEPETNPVHKQTFEDFKRAMLTPVDVFRSDVTAPKVTASLHAHMKKEAS